ncbi:urease accessory protein [Herbaspirillum rubrisubalbicans]|uniref:Urease accessory protein n=1 Tax=Herbaspirillum rubrisubalbicans TaxID=80842 RepID=A0ABX9BW31_9BURK|nr:MULTISPECIES: HupE/UreJ family protein [Herbaspirillum]RAM62053.1 urease accessory protein [Herbaspirillum rubrisubalbicans]RAN43228.1 urease accessory protein [Herbaspirillum rubrisubalbicans]
MLTLSTKTRARLGVLAITVLATGVALAHPGHPDSTMNGSASMAAGFAHPFSGIDHLLAMLAVGVWAAQNKQRALWVLPLAFPLMMVMGALLAFSGVQVPGVETGIAASVAVLGLLIAFAVRMPLWGSTLVVSLFAMFHGYAHGVELPHGSSAALYGTGFIVATALLHAAGLGIGLVAGQKMADRVVRIGGVGIAAVGAYLLAA